MSLAVRCEDLLSLRVPDVARSRSLHRAADRPAADGPVELSTFTAETEPTFARGGSLERDGKLALPGDDPELYVPGDATVTRRSALAELQPTAESRSWLEAAVPWTGVSLLPDDDIGLTTPPILHARRPV